MASARIRPMYAPHEPFLLTTSKNLRSANRTVPPVSAARTVGIGTVGGMVTFMITRASATIRARASNAMITPANEPFPPQALALPQMLPNPVSETHARCHGRNESMNRSRDPPARILSGVDIFVMSNEGRWAIHAPFELPRPARVRARADSRLTHRGSQLTGRVRLLRVARPRPSSEAAMATAPTRAIAAPATPNNGQWVATESRGGWRWPALDPRPARIARPPYAAASSRGSNGRSRARTATPVPTTPASAAARDPCTRHAPNARALPPNFDHGNSDAATTRANPTRARLPPNGRAGCCWGAG